MSDKEEFAELNLRGEKYKLPIMKASIGPDVLDVRKLYAETNMFTYDPGFMSTASCESEITYIDGNNGILRHRGYDIKDLADKSDFLSVSYLLLKGDMPNKAEEKEFKDSIATHSLVNEQIRNIFGAFRHSAHPMAIMMSVVGSLAAFYYDRVDFTTPDGREDLAIRLIAKMPTLAAMSYKYSVSEAFIYPHEDYSFTENFLRMMFANPREKYKVNKVLARALDKIFILHADHEQNASTSTVRTTGSSGPNAFACISAGIASLWGPSHGGANEAVINMLNEIGDVKNIKEYILKAKDKEDPFKLMGFGHRVYKNYDPRAAVLRETCKEVLDELGMLKGNPMLEIAMELEKIALSDEYFIERKLYPNVDFYSGIIYRAMGIPSKMFTVLFAVARTAGWISQWKEMIEDDTLKITRPRQLYRGHVKRDLKS